MKKSKKVLLIVLLSLVVALGITYIVFYCIKPTTTQKITTDTIDYICNKPLPIVGVSTLVLAVAIFKIVKIIVTTKSIKMQQVYNELKAAQEEIDCLKDLLRQLKYENDKKYEEHKNSLKIVCKASPNKKIKKLGDSLYGEKVDSIAKAKEI